MKIYVENVGVALLYLLAIVALFFMSMYFHGLADPLFLVLFLALCVYLGYKLDPERNFKLFLWVVY